MVLSQQYTSAKNASPILARRKPNKKIPLLFDPRKKNTRVLAESINNNHPVSTITDAGEHVAGINLFC